VNEYPSLAPCINGSAKAKPCVFGDTHGSHTMVLFGDSHAYMWFPAVDLIAKAAKWKLVALMNFGCPFADVTVWNIVTNAPNAMCPSYRQAMITRINKLHPALVIVSESFYALNAQDKTITNAQWTTGVEESFAALHGKSMKKVLIGDTFLLPNPIPCLSAYPSSIQTCSRPEASATATAQRQADQTAATASKVTYINEIPWECSATCTVVIGNMIAYFSSGHLSATYATYLTGVLQEALKPLLRAS
jgi:SGNH domain (fused to AT3 domains)